MDKCHKCRQHGAKLFLKGSRCLSPKCSFTRRNYRPGVFGAKKTSRRKSEYGLQLLEKQKAKAEYGIRERQFRNIFKNAAKSHLSTQEELLSLLETRLDNIVYRLGWAESRAQARQLVTHKKIKVNSRLVNIPSMVLKAKDIIVPAQKETVQISQSKPPKWLKFDPKKNQAEVISKPSRQDIESDLEEQLIIEYYSR